MFELIILIVLVVGGWQIGKWIKAEFLDKQKGNDDNEKPHDY